MPIRHPVRIVLAGLALGLIFDRLVMNHALGVGVPLFVALVLGALTLTLSWEKAAPERAALLRQNVWVFAPLLFFAAMIAVRANGFITFLNVMAVLVLLSVVALYLLRRPLTAVNIPGYVLAPLLGLVMAAVQGAQTSRQAGAVTASAWRGQRSTSWAPILRGVLLAGPVVLIFALLLSSADMMFAEVLRRILPVDFVTFMKNLLTHGMVMLIVGFLLLGGLAYTVWRSEHGTEPDVALSSISAPKMLGLTESGVVFNAVNVLFAAFVVIQIPYLFGGQLNIDLGRTTYAEYARQGFGELVTTSVLVLGMLLVLGALTRRDTARQRTIFNLSCTIMVGLTVVMLVSAFKRLLLYEEAYGFTEMRVYPHVFMVWLALLLGWFLVTLWLKPDRFAIGVVVACIGFVATLDVMNVDAFIVRQNVRRYEQMGASAFKYRDTYTEMDERIDTAYLTQLSDDAIPALVESVDRLAGQPRWNVENHLQERAAVLQQLIYKQPWSAFHLAQWRASYALTAWQSAQP